MVQSMKMNLNLVVLALAVAIWLSACSQPQEVPAEPVFEVEEPATNEVRLSSEIEWEQLNPARGDKSPLAGTVWGDRQDTVATGFLAKFVDGFSSPPHIHNVTYRALVIKGLIHNDDPDAANMWMPPGSFWTQPAGEPHITSAQGEENICYVEIDSGPYLVNPLEEAFDNGERPVNVDARNIVWLDASATTLIAPDPVLQGVKLAFLWENNDYTGYMLRLPAGVAAEVLASGEVFRAIIVSGELSYQMPASEERKGLDPGSYFGSTRNARHSLAAGEDGPVEVYIRTNGTLKIERGEGKSGQ